MSEWISVEATMPSDRESVLVSNGDDVGYCYRSYGSWFVCASNEYTATPVTHWMPLPEPPK